MATEIDIVRDVSRKLDQGGIGYMLTGSMAMNYYAQRRMTRDIDVVAAVGPNDVEQMAWLFETEYYLSKESMRESIAQAAQIQKVSAQLEASKPAPQVVNNP